MDTLDARYRVERTQLLDAARVFNAHRMSDGQRVFVKHLATDYPTAEELAGLRHEFAVLRRLAEAGAPVATALELVRYERGQALVLAEAPGIALSSLIARGPIEPLRFCELAIAAAKCLEAVHRAGVVHKDVKPSHFLVDEATQAATLIDFGLATELSRERARSTVAERLEGTLPYIAPEQTGRMNRSVDQRSDLYSLGVSFYELATGRRPFESEDALELIHAHLARVPAAPADVRQGLPAILSEIVMRLLEKVPDDRYQTASGLRADLERARDQLSTPGSAESFELGRDDHVGELRIPEALYGREEQRRALLAAFERVRGGATELLLITGSAGVGKSAVVQEVHRELVQGGQFVSGKFDQYDRGVPYSALAAACGELVRVHLTASTAALEAWKRRVKTALGENARVVADVVPELELALGPQPAVPALPPSEALSRFERAFQHFLWASATSNCPLVLFLDDLQWADSASLAVLRQVLSSGEQRYLLLIGSYRDEEVDYRHPLTSCLEALQDRLPIHRIEVGPLRAADVERLVCDALPFRSQAVEPLVRLIVDKTSGNPFFVVQFLQRLEAEGLLRFDRSHGFSWDIAAIAALDATDNVIDLVVRRLARLEQSARELLPLAACIGHTFRLSTLVAIADKTPHELLAGLQLAAVNSLIVPLDRSHRVLRELLDDPGTSLDASYRFIHDRVQQAAYVTIPEAERSEMHLRIGRLLLRAAGNESSLDADLFEVVGQLNRGRQHLREDERSQLARLNLRAAERASAAAAYQAALEFSMICLELLGEDPWSQDHAAALAAHLVAIASHYLAGRDDRALALIQVVEDNAEGALERVPARNLKTDLLTNQGRLDQAILESLKTLALLGEQLPDPHDKAAIGASIGEAFGAYQAALGAREVASIKDLPPMTDPGKLAQLATMAGAIPAAFQLNPELNVLLVLRAVHLSLCHGTGPTSPFFYALYGIVHHVVTGDYARAFLFGQLALELVQRPEHAVVRCRVHFIFATHLSPWVRPLQESFEHHEKGIAFGLDGSDLIHAGYCMGLGAAYRLYDGQPLSEVASRAAAYREVLEQTGNVINLSFLTGIQRLIDNLTGKTARFGSLDGAGFSELEFEKDASPTARATYGVNKAMARYLAGDSAAALLTTEEFHPLPGLYYNAEYVFYHGMACADVAANAEGARREELLARLDQDLEKFRLWSGFCSDNFSARYALLRAESCAVRGQKNEALDAYELAVEPAAAVSLHQLALACERAGRFHHRHGRQRLAKDYLIEACYHYERWGATAKVAQLREQFPSITRRAAAEARVTETISESTTTTTSEALDLTSAMRATQALASELRLEPLVRRLMRILVENAGATHGCLVLPQGDALEVNASLMLEPETIEVGLHEPLETSSRIPVSIVQYCARSRAAVVLADAGADQRFAHDPQVVERKRWSVACLPLLHQGRLAGVLYLENETGTGMFHSGRVQKLEFLGGHAAVALQNALLYDQLQEANETLERRVADRTAELSARNADMRRVLDHVSQGLLTVDLAGRLASERSSVVDDWFGAFEPGAKVGEYLARLDPKFARSFELMFEMLVEGFLPEELAVGQLPAAMSYGDRHYHFSYEPIRTGDALVGLLLVVGDVTEALKRAEEDAEQKEQLAVARWLSRDRENLLGFFEEGRALVERVCGNSTSVKDVRAPLHTLKGNAGMLGFEVLAKICHSAENAIEDGTFGPQTVSELTQRWGALEACLELLLGHDGRNLVEVPRSDLAAVVARLRAGASAQEALEVLERFELQPLSRPLGHLGARALELSQRAFRKELAIRVDDGGLLGDTREGSKLWAALVHLVRNAVDHGIEPPEERSTLGKALPATLEFRADLDGDCAVIEIADDGRGIPWERLQARARERGLPSSSRAELIEALFAPSLSLRDDVTTMSGRGIGLDAVRREVEALGGSIELESEPGRGCRFRVRVPARALGVRPKTSKADAELPAALRSGAHAQPH
jgi:predicted ATPase/GAF domain-containing protein/HPt (histidine-containing phosphotransfer) domain-containing protein